MRIIGIDPGTATTGFSVVEVKNDTLALLDYGCITTPANTDLTLRLDQIAQSLNTLISQWSPSHAAIEQLFFSKNVKTALSVAHARGVMLHQLHTNKIKIAEYNPLQIKIAVCGHGRAEKHEVQKMVQITFSLPHPPRPDDAADAIAIALCHAHSHKIAQLAC